MRWVIAIAALALTPGVAHAQEAVIRIWGTPALQGAAERWAGAYARDHPGVRFEYAMKGSDSAIHGLVPE